MNGPTHVAGGLAAATAVSLVFSVDLKTGLIGVAVGGVTALIPDWFNIAFPGINLAGFEGHRGVSHWLLTALGIAYLFAGRWPGLWQYCLAGYCSHLFLDMLTERGIPLLGPLPMQFRFAPFRNGGAVDHIIGALSLLASISMLVIWIVGLVRVA
jgi:inner membrane protein